MSRFFKVFVTTAITIAGVQAFSHFKPALVKIIQASPFSSRTLGPPKGVVSAQELVDSREATLLFKGEAHEVRCQPVLPEIIAKIRHPEPYVLHLTKACVYGDKGVVIAPLCDKILDDSACECSGNPEALFVFDFL